MTTTNENAVAKINRAGTVAINGRSVNVTEHADGTVIAWTFDPRAGTGGPEELSADMRSDVQWCDAQMVVIEFLASTGRGGELALAPWPLNHVKITKEAAAIGARDQVSIFDSANYSPSDICVVSGPMPMFATGWISRLGGLRGLVAMYPAT